MSQTTTPESLYVVGGYLSTFIETLYSTDDSGPQTPHSRVALDSQIFIEINGVVLDRSSRMMKVCTWRRIFLSSSFSSSSSSSKALANFDFRVVIYQCLRGTCSFS